MADLGVTAGTRVPVFIYYSEDAPWKCFPLMVNSYHMCITDVMNEMRRQQPHEGWGIALNAADFALQPHEGRRIALDAADFALRHVVEPDDEDDRDAAVLQTFRSAGAHVNPSSQLTAFQDERMLPPRFVVVSSASLPDASVAGLKRCRDAQDVSVASSTPTKVFRRRHSSGVYALPAEHEYVTFYNALLEADPDADGHIELPAGVTFLSFPSNVLFVRDFYSPFFDDVLQLSRKSHEDHRFIVLGAPGIGKSAFGMYLLYRCLREGRDVVYRSASLGCMLLFKQGSVYWFDVNRFVDIHELDESAVYVCDDIDPGYFPVFTILISAPKRDVWWGFHKHDNCETLYFPTFSAREIFQMRERCFRDAACCSYNEVAERLRKWGGIPRYVLAQLSTDDQHQLDSALDTVTWDSIVDLLPLGSFEVECDAFYRVFLYTIAGHMADSPRLQTQMEYYSKKHMDFATDYVRDALFRRIVKHRPWRIMGILNGSIPTRSLPWLDHSLLRKRLVEAHINDILQTDATLRCRWLEKGVSAVETSITLKAAKLEYFTDIADLAMQYRKDACFRAFSSWTCAFDGVFRGMVFNVAVGAKQSLSLTISPSNPVLGLKQLADMLGWNKEGDIAPITFAWFVPDDVYPLFTQPAQIPEGGETCKESDAFCKRIQQLVICVPLDVFRESPLSSASADVAAVPAANATLSASKC